MVELGFGVVLSLENVSDSRYNGLDIDFLKANTKSHN